MSKALAILYSVLILVQSFNINTEDFSKLDVLIEHAKFHKEVYGDSFLEFLIEHYGEQVTTDYNEHEEHDDLPFKNHQQMQCSINVAFILNAYPLYQCHAFGFQEVPLNFHYKESSSIFEKPSVFQPPKTV
ncbi:hypothetical protein [Algibacter mikhailovii]|uniref:hypothetical protein n=1 Tax=Algibacter mikhailovii TaxID=425498 RepID=UPI002493F6A2|nr:hypothetical protein [Algibacter mikhailovii]